ncbi:hypothetical protein FRB90_010254 [Tulasnella sp. 427]|nr:hypothetical protein FRB90_010254 [Tulasnella sp. 427]
MAPSQQLLKTSVEELMQANNVLEDLSVSDVIHFITITSLFKNEIEQHRQSMDQDSSHPPQFLSETMTLVLAQVLETSVAHITRCWAAFKEVVWDDSSMEEIARVNSDLIKSYGIKHQFTEHSLYPPDHTCINPACPRLGIRLTSAEARKVVLYTMNGSVPAYSVHLRCHASNGCRTDYHHNYYVQDGKRRYYGGVPDVIQIGEHHFVQKKVVEMWQGLMLHAWYVIT